MHRREEDGKDSASDAQGVAESYPTSAGKDVCLSHHYSLQMSARKQANVATHAVMVDKSSESYSIKIVLHEL